MDRGRILRLALVTLGLLAACLIYVFFARGTEVAAQTPGTPVTSTCTDCHATATPGIVTQWFTCKMAVLFECSHCHGRGHNSNDDVGLAALPTPDTCRACHSPQVDAFRQGKHALAWAAMKAMPFVQHEPLSIVGPVGFKGCSGCHKVGEKSADEMKTVEFEYGTASCDSCHTRHRFSKAEAQDPRACQTCHLGFDHPQWEMYSTSKHGTIWEAEGNTGRAPRCQDCHLPGGTHNNITPWGFLALRAYPEADASWQADRVTILKALGVLDASGNPTDRLNVVVGAKVVRTTADEFNAIRARFLNICANCHGEGFVTQQFQASDGLIRQADSYMAEAINVVNGLYRDGYLKKPADWTYAPDLLQFYHTNSAVEQELFTMFLEYRQRTFQGSFHNNPDYTYWYGLAQMQNSLQHIKDGAAALRAESRGAGTVSAVAIAGLAVGTVALGLGGYLLYRQRE